MAKVPKNFNQLVAGAIAKGVKDGLEKYSEDQPRDDHGRFGSGGGGGKGGKGDKPLPKAAKDFAQFHQGYDPQVERPDGKMGAHVFEFNNAKQQQSFLSRVGGSPHPLGGHRAILSTK